MVQVEMVERQEMVLVQMGRMVEVEVVDWVFSLVEQRLLITE